MGKIISFNRAMKSSAELISEGEFFNTRSDGSIEYTQEGVSRFSAMFRARNIDIRKVQTLDDHSFAVERSAPQTSQEDLAQFTDLDAKLLKALMLSTSEDEISQLERDIEIRDRISN